MTTTPSGALSQRYDHGIRLRRRTPREQHAELLGPAHRDPVAILAAGDRTRIPELIPVRYERMLASPFAFLRGAAAVMRGGPETSANSRGCCAGLWRLPSDELWSVLHPGGEHSF